MLTGFPANSVFIVDSEDRVRHHTVLDPRFLGMMLCAMLLMLIFLLGLAVGKGSTGKKRFLSGIARMMGGGSTRARIFLPSF